MVRGVTFVTNNSREFFKFESVRCDLVLFSINIMDENASSHVSVVPKQRITLSDVFISEKFKQGKGRQKQISEAEKNSSNVVFNTEFGFKSMRSNCMSLCILIIFSALSKKSIINRKMQSLTKSQKCNSKDSCNNYLQ